MFETLELSLLRDMNNVHQFPKTIYQWRSLQVLYLSLSQHDNKIFDPKGLEALEHLTSLKLFHVGILHQDWSNVISSLVHLKSLTLGYSTISADLIHFPSSLEYLSLGRDQKKDTKSQSPKAGDQKDRDQEDGDQKTETQRPEDTRRDRE